MAPRLVIFLALRQLWDKKLLNLIAALGVALGVAALITMNSIMQGFQMKFKGEILKISPHVTVYAKELDTSASLGIQWARAAGAKGPVLVTVAHEQPNDRTVSIKRPHELVHALERMPEVEAACRGINGQAILSFGTKNTGVDMRGVDPDEQNRCTPIAGYVEHGSWRAFAGARDGVVLGSGIAETLGAKVGDRVTLVAPAGGAVTLDVVGVFEVGIPAVDKARVYVNLEKAQTVLQRGSQIGRIEVRLRDPEASEPTARRIEAVTGYDTEGWQEANANFLSLFAMQNMIVGIQIASILTVGGFGILAIQIMLVMQRLKDISILRSIGLTRRDILFGVLIQGCLTAIVGGLTGDLLGWRIVKFLGSLKVKSEGLVKSSTFVVYEDPRFFVYGVVFALVVGAAASLVPAFRAARVEPVAVLRGQVG